MVEKRTCACCGDTFLIATCGGGGATLPHTHLVRVSSSGEILSMITCGDCDFDGPCEACSKWRELH